MVATLNIGTGTAYYGVKPTASTPNSLISKQAGLMNLCTGSENYWVGKAVGGGRMEDAINLSYTVLRSPRSSTPPSAGSQPTQAPTSVAGPPSPS